MEDTSEDHCVDTDEALTDSEHKRWEWLSTLVGGITALSLPLLLYLHSEGMITLTSISWRWYLLYFGGYTAAIKFTLGRGEFSALREMLTA